MCEEDACSIRLLMEMQDQARPMTKPTTKPDPLLDNARTISYTRIRPSLPFE